MSWSIRSLTSVDAVAVASIARASRRESMPWLPELHSAAQDAEHFATGLAVATGWGVDVDDRVVGFALSRDGWLEHLYVLPGWQGRGIGSALLRRAIGHRLADGGRGDLDLWVFERNRAALDFYVRHGFTEVARTDGSGNEEREPDVHLRRAGVVIREAVAADVEGICRAHVASWRGAYRNLLPQDTLDSLDWRDRAARWTALLAGDAGVRVAESEDRVVGFCVVGPPRDEDLAQAPGTWFELYSIYLVPEYWGVGLGGRLWEAARSGIPSDASGVSLWVLEGNDRARAFYEGQGFRPDGRRETTTRAGRELPEVRYIVTPKVTQVTQR